VNVINTIQTTTDQVDVMMRRVATYKQNIQTTADNIKKLRSELDETRGYVEEFALFLYQTSNYITDPQKGSIDEIKLLVHSDNIPRTLANQQIVEGMLMQFNVLLEKLDAEILIQIQGYDETFAHDVHVRYSYTWKEFVWDAKFAPAYNVGDDSTVVMHLDKLNKFDKI